jgi:hypothetical protein
MVMKKTVIYSLLLVAACLVSCKEEKWDTGEELRGMTIGWANEFVYNTLNRSIKYVDTVLVSDDRTVSASLRDSLFVTVHYAYNKQPEKDSVDVTSTLTQIRDSIIVMVDGYRYSQKYWAHLFTVDPGIINYEGKFHVDFYEIGKTTPWAWSEITYSKYKDGYFPYKTKAVVQWY